MYICDFGSNNSPSGVLKAMSGPCSISQMGGKTRGSPNPAFKGNDHHTDIVMVLATISMWNIQELMEVHPCSIDAEEALAFFKGRDENALGIVLRKSSLERINAYWL